MSDALAAHPSRPRRPTTLSLNVAFVPTNSSHFPKNRLLLDTLAARGCSIRVLCMDALLKPVFHSRPQIEVGGYPYRCVPAQGFDPNRHWIRSITQRSLLRRVLTTEFGAESFDVALFGGDDDLVSYSAGVVFRSLGVPTVLIIDGYMGPANPLRHEGLLRRARIALTTALQRRLGLGVTARTGGHDRLLLMNASGRSALVDLGVPPEHIRLVGSPEYDALARAERASAGDAAAGNVHELLGLAPERPIVFFAHQCVPIPKAVMRRTLLRMVEGARLRGAFVLIKLHPRSADSPEAWTELARADGIGANELRIIRDECTSIDAVRACAVCLTFFSTVAFEAMILGKPVVQMQFHNFRYTLMLSRTHDCFVEVFDPDAVHDAVVQVLTDPSLRERLAANSAQALESELCGLDGRSVERMIESIVELVDERRNGAQTQGERGPREHDAPRTR